MLPARPDACVRRLSLAMIGISPRRGGYAMAGGRPGPKASTDPRAPPAARARGAAAVICCCCAHDHGWAREVAIDTPHSPRLHIVARRFADDALRVTDSEDVKSNSATFSHRGLAIEPARSGLLSSVRSSFDWRRCPTRRRDQTKAQRKILRVDRSVEEVKSGVAVIAI